MDEIPNKIKNLMGITAEVNLLEEDSKHFIEIVVQPYSVPISLRGRYYYRSGSVKQELTGVALNEFLLKRAGLTWDEVVEPRATFADIDEEAFRLYLQMAKEKGRICLMPNNSRMDAEYAEISGASWAIVGQIFAKNYQDYKNKRLSSVPAVATSKRASLKSTPFIATKPLAQFTFMLDTTAKRLENEKSGMIIEESGMKNEKSSAIVTETTRKQPENNQKV